MPTPLPPGQYQRVLAIDTDTEFLSAVKKVVETGRCRVECVGNAAEALARLEHDAYDLVICDAHLPELEPVELYARVAERLPEGLQLLFLSSQPLSEPERLFFEERRLTCLEKPLHLRRFLDKLDDLLLLAAQPPEVDEGGPA